MIDCDPCASKECGKSKLLISVNYSVTLWMEELIQCRAVYDFIYVLYYKALNDLWIE